MESICKYWCFNNDEYLVNICILRKISHGHEAMQTRGIGQAPSWPAWRIQSERLTSFSISNRDVLAPFYIMSTER